MSSSSGSVHEKYTKIVPLVLLCVAPRLAWSPEGRHRVMSRDWWAKEKPALLERAGNASGLCNLRVVVGD